MFVKKRVLSLLLFLLVLFVTVFFYRLFCGLSSLFEILSIGVFSSILVFGVFFVSLFFE